MTSLVVPAVAQSWPASLSMRTPPTMLASITVTLPSP
jgi:hypothetical protein